MRILFLKTRRLREIMHSEWWRYPKHFLPLGSHNAGGTLLCKSSEVFSGESDYPKKKDLKMLILDVEFLQPMDEPDDFKWSSKSIRITHLLRASNLFLAPTHKYEHRLSGIWEKPLMWKRTEQTKKWKQMGENRNYARTKKKKHFKKPSLIPSEK